MSLGSTGILPWSDPLQGAYTVTVTAKDSKTGLSGRGVYSVIIAGVPPPPGDGVLGERRDDHRQLARAGHRQVHPRYNAK
jgi:hypothetical protein